MQSSARKFLLTINNPIVRGYSHQIIKEKISNIKPVAYWCMADEIGEQGTPHTHIFLSCLSVVRFATLKKIFPDAHIDPSRGTGEENKAYVQKSGKWDENKKSETSVEGSFEEGGELPEELGQGYRSDIAQLYGMICDGMTNAEIMAENPSLAVHISRMDKIRQDVLEAQYKDEWRQVAVTYIWGATGTGKTRGVMEKYGYGEVYRVTDYTHPFDRYASQPVLCLDEFRSSLMIGDMLDYLDGYPLALPARYAQRQACYTEVYIISNIDIMAQYPNIQLSEPATWKAFLRRIGRVVKFFEDGHINVYDMKDYPHSFIEMDAHELPDVFPFDQEKKPPEYDKSDQTKLPTLKATSDFLDGVLGIEDKPENEQTGGVPNGESQETGGNP